MGLLGWAIMFLVIAVIAALFGFTGIAAGAATIARVLFGIFLVVFVVLLIMALLGGAAAVGAPVGALPPRLGDCLDLAIATSFVAIPARGALQPA